MKYLRKVLLTLLVVFGLFFSFDSVGQGSLPPSPPSGGHGLDSNQDGGRAPIGSGLVILIGLGTVYGGKKLYNIYKEKLEE